MAGPTVENICAVPRPHMLARVARPSFISPGSSGATPGVQWMMG